MLQSYIQDKHVIDYVCISTILSISQSHLYLTLTMSFMTVSFASICVIVTCWSICISSFLMTISSCYSNHLVQNTFFSLTYILFQFYLVVPLVYCCLTCLSSYCLTFILLSYLYLVAPLTPSSPQSPTPPSQTLTWVVCIPENLAHTDDKCIIYVRMHIFSKDLNFVPLCPIADNYTLLQNPNHIIRRVHLQYHIRNKKTVESTTNDEPAFPSTTEKCRTQWFPLPPFLSTWRV